MCCAVSKFVMNEWCSIEEVYAAYLDCKKRKSKSTSYTRFAANEAANIYSLWEDLNNRTYTIGRSDAFCVTRPKVREVFAAQFRDRIVHHLLMLRLLQHFEEAFIEDTYNCRKGKGTDLGNSPDPLDLIEKYGADAVRLGMLLCSSAGNDILYDESQIEQGRNFNNKVWNAFRLGSAP